MTLDRNISITVFAGLLLLISSLMTSCGYPRTTTSQQIASASPTLPLPTPTVLRMPSQTPDQPLASETASQPEPVSTPTETPISDGGDPVYADVLSVETSGQDGSYQFSVRVHSPDTGCEQFADWWEVLSPDGELLYRRILLHSHVGEQPFSRSGGPVKIGSGDMVIVRAHMNTSGYGGMVLQGSPGSGFEPVSLPPGFASDLEQADPQPGGCAF